MTVKRIVVHLDGGSRATVRLDLAVRLAQRCGAQLIGLFADGGAGRTTGGLSAPAWREAAEAMRAALEGRARDAGLTTGWWRIDEAELEPGGMSARYCRYADLAVVGQHDPEHARVPADFAERVLLESGRPVLVVPYAGAFPDAGRRAVVAWDGTREAARALGDALPLLAGAEKLLVALLTDDGSAAELEASSTASVVAYLAAHGLAATAERVRVDDRGRRGVPAADAVLNAASDAGADLVVAGARGSHGVPFPRASKETRARLEAMTAPVLFSL